MSSRQVTGRVSRDMITAVGIVAVMQQLRLLVPHEPTSPYTRGEVGSRCPRAGAITLHDSLSRDCSSCNPPGGTHLPRCLLLVAESGPKLRRPFQ